mgnify:CR=1 FL=1
MTLAFVLALELTLLPAAQARPAPPAPVPLTLSAAVTRARTSSPFRTAAQNLANINTAGYKAERAEFRAPIAPFLGRKHGYVPDNPKSLAHWIGPFRTALRAPRAGSWEPPPRVEGPYSGAPRLAD